MAEQTQGAPKKKKRSAKEVLAQIKKLYSEKKFAEALKLCDTLVKRFPDNSELADLRQKIYTRHQKAEAAAQTVQEFESPDVGESTTVLMNRADAVAQAEAEAAAAAEDETPQDPNAPSKDDLVRIYNEGLGLFKSGQYEAAMEKWNYILSYYPDHQDTLVCLDKTKKAIETEAAFNTDLQALKDAVHDGHFKEAETLLEDLAAKKPDHPDLLQLRETLENRKRQITEIKSMELEEEHHEEAVHSASEEEITRYFTPGTDQGAPTPARKVVQAAPPIEKTNWGAVFMRLGIVVVVLGVLAGAGWYGWDQYQRTLRTGQTTDFSHLLNREVEWDSALARAEHFQILAEEFFADDDQILAHYAAEQAKAVTTIRLADLAQKPADALKGEYVIELRRLNHTKDQLQALTARLKPLPEETGNLSSTAVQKGMDLIAAEKYPQAIETLHGLLSQEPKNDALRNTLALAEEQYAFAKYEAGELDEALVHFKRAAVLKATDQMLRNHIYAIEKYFDATINEEDKNQWFFFFASK